MNVKYRSVLALALSVGLVVQAPIVAFATDGTSVPVDFAVDSEGNGTSTPADVVASTPTANYYNVASDIQVSSNTDAALELSNASSNPVSVTAENKTISNDNGDAIVVSSGNISLYAQGSSTVTGNVVNDGLGNINLNNGLTGNISTSSGSVISSGDVSGNLTNNGGTIGIVGNVGGDVSATGSGSIGITGKVTEDVFNSDASGNIYILRGVDGEISSYGNPISGTKSGYTEVGITGNATVIDATIKESQINHNDGNLYVYKVIDDTNNDQGLADNIHYLIESPYGVFSKAIENTTTTEEGSVTTYSVGDSLDRVYNMMMISSVPVNYSQFWEYADKGQKIIFTLASGYNLTSTSVMSINLGNGRYLLTVPEGGGIAISASAIRAIEEVISQETGAPAVVVNPTVADNSSVISNANNNEITVVSTAAGADLPIMLGTASVPTKSISLDLTKVSPAQYRDAVVNTVEKVAPGGAFVIETNSVSCFDRTMINSIAKRNDISVNVVFKYNGQKLRVIIPAGFDVSTLLDANGYCGFLRLASILGFTILQ